LTILNITSRKFEEEDRQDVQRSVMAQVLADPERFLTAYTRHKASFGGRYVSADLMKEMFVEFNANPETRNRYNAAVHNAAAALSSVQYDRMIQYADAPEQDEAYFVTGIPGAGKTTAVLYRDELPPSGRVVFEGQLSNPMTGLEKIEKALKQGLAVTIRVVHREPEGALDNTLKRFREYGRGASIGLMADIQAKLPDGLAEIRKQLGDKIRLEVYNYRRPNEYAFEGGWDVTERILRKEGDRDAIYNRLYQRLEDLNRGGQLSPDAYAQAFGQVLDHGRTRSDQAARTRGNDGGAERAVGESRTASQNPQARVLTPTEDAIARFLDLAEKRKQQRAGFSDQGSDWRNVPTPLRVLVDQFNAGSSQTQAGVLHGLNDRFKQAPEYLKTFKSQLDQINCPSDPDR